MLVAGVRVSKKLRKDKERIVKRQKGVTGLIGDKGRGKEVVCKG